MEIRIKHSLGYMLMLSGFTIGMLFGLLVDKLVRYFGGPWPDGGFPIDTAWPFVPLTIVMLASIFFGMAYFGEWLELRTNMTYNGKGED